MITAEDLKQIALDLNIPHTALLDTCDIQFHDDFRKACEKNVCGKYNATWMGPPVIGPIRELKKKVLCFRQGLLLQTVHRVAGSLDMKGMLAAAGEHRTVFRSFLEKIRNKFPDDNFLHCTQFVHFESIMDILSMKMILDGTPPLNLLLLIRGTI